MKIAVCLSGHSRNYMDNFPNIPFEVDYFISTYKQSGVPEDRLNYFIPYHYLGDTRTSDIDISDLLNLYKPKLYNIKSDEDIPKEMLKYVDLRTKKNLYLKHIGMMFYNIYIANELKKKYEYIHQFKYDFVIRSRFDVLINRFDFDTNGLYIISNKHQTIDYFFAGPSYIIDAISDCYVWFIHQKPEYLTNFGDAEEMFYHYINHLKIKKPFLNDFHITFNKEYPYQTEIVKNGLKFKYEPQNDTVTNLKDILFLK